MGILQLNKQPTFIQAIFCDDIEELQNSSCIDSDVLYEDREKRTALHAAAYTGNKKILEFLLENGAKVNAKDNRWLTPLHRACRSGNDEILKILLQHKAEPLARNRQWQTAVHISASFNSLGCLRVLSEIIPDLNIRDRCGRTPLHYAAHQGHDEVVRFLIEKGCVVNARDCKDRTPIHLATSMGHIETVETLIKNKADIEAKDNKNFTPLNIAAAMGYEELSTLLLDLGANTSTRNNMGNGPLHTACLNGHVNVCNVLIEHGASLEALNHQQQTPLHMAICSPESRDCFDYLLSSKVNVNAKDRWGRTALHLAIAKEKVKNYFGVFMSKGASIDERDSQGSTVFHYAAMYDQKDILAELVQKYRADVNSARFDGMTALHLSCATGHVSCCSFLVESGADINSKDKSGKTAIHWAVLGRSCTCLETLVDNGANIWVQDSEHRTVIHYAAMLADFDCLLYLDNFKFPVNCQDIYGCTPMHLLSTSDSNGSCLRYFLRRHADVKLHDRNGYNCFHYAALNGNYRILSKLFFAVGPSLSNFGKWQKAVTPLHLAAKQGHSETLEELLEYFPGVDGQTERGSTALMVACRYGHLKCAQLLINNYADCTLTDADGMSALHHCARSGHTELVRLFLRHKEILDYVDNGQRTALSLAVEGGHTECVEILLKGFANPNCPDKDSNFTPLYKAVCLGNVKVVQLLLRFGANAKIKDKSGKGIVHVAAATGNYKCLEVLFRQLELQDLIDLDRNGFSVLHWLASKGNFSCMKYILEENLFKTLTGHEFSPLHCAASSEATECLELLVKHFCCVDRSDPGNNDDNDNDNNNKSAANYRDHLGRPLVSIIVRTGNLDCLNAVLKHVANIAAVDGKRRNCLMVAARFGHVHLIGVLLNSKRFDLGHTDSSGNTALHYACIGNHSACASSILECIQTVDILNIKNITGKTALHIAAANGMDKIVARLIEKGANISAKDNQGLAAMFHCSSTLSNIRCMSLLLRKLLRVDGPADVCALPASKIFLESKPHDHPGICKALTTAASLTQTDITMVRNPDKFEFEHYFNVKPANKEDEKGTKKTLKANIHQIKSDKGHALHKTASEISIGRTLFIRANKNNIGNNASNNGIKNDTGVDKTVEEIEILSKRFAINKKRKIETTIMDTKPSSTTNDDVENSKIAGATDFLRNDGTLAENTCKQAADTNLDDFETKKEDVKIQFETICACQSTKLSIFSGSVISLPSKVSDKMESCNTDKENIEISEEVAGKCFKNSAHEDSLKEAIIFLDAHDATEEYVTTKKHSKDLLLLDEEDEVGCYVPNAKQSTSSDIFSECETKISATDCKSQEPIIIDDNNSVTVVVGEEKDEEVTSATSRTTHSVIDAKDNNNDDDEVNAQQQLSSVGKIERKNDKPDKIIHDNYDYVNLSRTTNNKDETMTCEQKNKNKIACNVS